MRQKSFSLITKLRKEGKSSEIFESILNVLTLEELIGLKLELASKAFKNKIYGFPIWYNLKHIVNKATLIYAAGSSKSKSEAAQYLGIDLNYFNEIYKKYNIEEYFDIKP